MIKAAATTKVINLDKGVLHRCLPFALFMAFIAIDEALLLAARWQVINVADSTASYLYPIKALAVGLLLYKYRGSYNELRWKDLLNVKTTTAVSLAGFATFILWISLDASFAASGAPRGFNPTLIPEGAARVAMTAVRIAGAVIVVPVMEELFWRSFLLRYLVNPGFESVRLGTFTWFSFLATVTLFGLEHYFIVAGMVAGAIYNIILYQTRSLAQCVFAHAVTNLTLACYVLYTGKWYFW